VLCDSILVKAEKMLQWVYPFAGDCAGVEAGGQLQTMLFTWVLLEAQHCWYIFAWFPCCSEHCHFCKFEKKFNQENLNNG
jgi:hypothetical protein